MSKEGETALQFELFASRPLKSTSSEQIEATTPITIEEAFKKDGDLLPHTDQSVTREREAGAPTLREVRAVSSLLRNRLQMEAVERRIQKTAAIILSYLMTQDSLSAQIGPYLVWLNEDSNIEVLRTLSYDDWQQLYLPKIRSESIKED